MEQPAVTIDPLLEPLLDTSEERIDEFLSRLISEHAEPVIKGVVRYKLRLNSSQAIQRAEAEDIYQDVLVQFVTQVQQFRQKPEQHPITDVRGMAAVIAHRACSRRRTSLRKIAACRRYLPIGPSPGRT